ncbi:hypothetical protein CcCBS67573_g08247 [Chytriomyces confervae]|uniref:Endo-beta-1,6-galactanase-like domain-containing protein n=1 Tax=Chytriomyces confervae TaxID=246404 RepID=A0A507ENV9_9FUNG|nr:hypothetical protein CcCBS67573_g08247 [Chytriomyces confervae]
MPPVHMHAFLYILLISSATLASRSNSATFSISANASNTLIPKWEGFGASLSSWAVAAGGSQVQSKLADLFYSTKTVTVMVKGKERRLPGLGLNIVRYNIGGTGKERDYPGRVENYKEGPSKFGVDWWKLVQGYWIRGPSDADSNWDWARDARQRSMLKAIMKKKVDRVEFYSNAPMWWMTKQNSSLGGTLSNDAIPQFAKYVTNVVRQAIFTWRIPVTSVSILNEPSGGLSKYKQIDHEGINVSVKDQVALLDELRSQLDNGFMGSVDIAGPDERNISLATKTLSKMLPLVDKYNVHGYTSSTIASQNAAREAFKSAVGSKKLWVSEYEDSSKDGMALVTALAHDILHLRPSAWLYGQLASTTSSQGLLRFNKPSEKTRRIKITKIHTRYFLLAQFTRFIRPGDEILATSSANAIVAYNPTTKRYKFVVVNYLCIPTVSVTIEGLKKGVLVERVRVTCTQADGKAMFKSFSAVVLAGAVVFRMEKHSVCSFTL